MLTVQSLIDDLGLELAAGASAAESPVRWVHISELEDPTPFLSGELYRRGLICRADDRGDPVIQLAPPLIAGSEQFEEMEAVLRPVLTEAWERVK